MRTLRRIALLAVLLVALVLVLGCAKYKITQGLSEPLGTAPVCQIGQITESLPADLEPENLPPMEDIDKFIVYLKEELDNKNIFQRVGQMEPNPTYEVTGNILSYNRGSGAVRFLIGFGLGSAKLTIEMKLRNTATGEVVFAGNFSQSVSSGYESGMVMYRRVAKDFAKELSKQVKKIAKG
jgi:hypothetical protein